MNDLQAQFAQLDIPKSLGIGLMIAALYYVVFFNSGKKIDLQIKNDKAALTKSQATLKKVQKAVKDQKKFSDEIKNITKNVKDFQKFFADDLSLNDLQANVSQFAEQNNLVVNNLKPFETEPEFKKYKETAVIFEVEGSFHNIMEFISSLTQMNKAIDFSKMEFSTVVSGDYPVIRLTTTLIVYSSEESETEAAEASA